MDHTLFNVFAELLKADCLPWSFKFTQMDGKFRLKPYVVFRSDPIQLSLQLAYNAIDISDTPGGWFSLNIG